MRSRRPIDSTRTRQCKACPWKQGVRPALDIPGGYCASKHRALDRTIAEPGSLTASRLVVSPTLGEWIRTLLDHVTDAQVIVLEAEALRTNQITVPPMPDFVPGRIVIHEAPLERLPTRARRDPREQARMHTRRMAGGKRR